MGCSIYRISQHLQHHKCCHNSPALSNQIYHQGHQGHHSPPLSNQICQICHLSQTHEECVCRIPPQLPSPVYTQPRECEGPPSEPARVALETVNATRDNPHQGGAAGMICLDEGTPTVSLTGSTVALCCFIIFTLGTQNVRVKSKRKGLSNFSMSRFFSCDI